MPSAVQSFSYDSDRDSDIHQVLLRHKEQGDTSAYMRKVIRFYEANKHKEDSTAMGEVIARLKSIEEKLNRGIPAILPDDLAHGDDLDFLSDIMGQIENGEFDK